MQFQQLQQAGLADQQLRLNERMPSHWPFSRYHQPGYNRLPGATKLQGSCVPILPSLADGSRSYTDLRTLFALNATTYNTRHEDILALYFEVDFDS